MSNGERLHYALNQYFALEQHRAEPGFSHALRDVQQWQMTRLFLTHYALMQQAETQRAAEFLFYQVYGGAQLVAVAKNIQRATTKATALLPQTVMRTAAITLEAAVLTQQLDEALTHRLGHTPITTDSYAQAYTASSTPQQRQQQLALIEEAATLIDRYVRRRLLINSFKMMRRPAYAAKLNPLYDFLDEGFSALGGLASITPVVTQLVTTENQISERLFSAHPDPFNGAAP